jgi:threonine dehydrogenase-like Zn-dependent dehydrogenase
MGLLTIACLRALGHRNPILASALQDHQKDLARKLGATEIVPVGHDLYFETATRTGARILRPDVGAPVLSHGVDCVYDCVASSGTLHQSFRIARPGGRVILVGMPGIPFGVDWTAIWHRELHVQGVYAYGQEIIDGKPRRTFDVAMEIMEKERDRLRPLLTHRYPLDDYRKALSLALSGGDDNSVKVAFEIGKA